MRQATDGNNGGGGKAQPKDDELGADQHAVDPWFDKVELVFDSDGAPIDVALTRAENGALSKEAEKLLATINLAAIRIQIAFRSFPEERRRLFDNLEAIARNGLVGKQPHPKTALIDFENFKINVAAAADTIRSSFLSGTIKVNLIAIFVAIFLLALWLPMHGVFRDIRKAMQFCGLSDPATQFCTDAQVRFALSLAKWANLDPTVSEAATAKAFVIGSNLAGAALFALCGISLGLILIGFLRNRLISYENFDSIFRYRMPPSLYLLFIACLGLTVLAIVAFDIVVLGVGNVSLNQVVTMPTIGIVVGLLCSISEPFVSALVVRQLRPTEKTGE